MPANTESPAARILAGSLRRAREAADMSLRTLGQKIGISYSVISYWETAQRVPRTADVASFLTAVGVTGDERETILDIAEAAKSPNYLSTSGSGISQGLTGVLECERAAQAIIEWSPLLVPGLVQTGEYARAILGAPDVSVVDVDAKVTLRLGRLKSVLDRARPATIDMLIGEAALRHQIGGREVMARQLRALPREARRAGLSLRVVPLGGDWHPGLIGSFVLYEFPTAPAIVHQELYRSGVFLFEQKDVANYKVAVDIVRGRALDTANSVQLIAEIADEVESSR